MYERHMSDEFLDLYKSNLEKANIKESSSRYSNWLPKYQAARGIGAKGIGQGPQLAPMEINVEDFQVGKPKPSKGGKGRG